MELNEIKKIIESFSKIAKIPLLQGMLRARVSNLEISGIIAETADSSFILKKWIIPNLNNSQNQFQNQQNIFNR